MKDITENLNLIKGEKSQFIMEELKAEVLKQLCSINDEVMNSAQLITRLFVEPQQKKEDITHTEIDQLTQTAQSAENERKLKQSSKLQEAVKLLCDTIESCGDECDKNSQDIIENSFMKLMKVIMENNDIFYQRSLEKIIAMVKENWTARAQIRSRIQYFKKYLEDLSRTSPAGQLSTTGTTATTSQPQTTPQPQSSSDKPSKQTFQAQSHNVAPSQPPSHGSYGYVVPANQQQPACQQPTHQQPIYQQSVYQQPQYYTGIYTAPPVLSNYLHHPQQQHLGVDSNKSSQPETLDNQNLGNPPIDQYIEDSGERIERYDSTIILRPDVTFYGSIFQTNLQQLLQNTKNNKSPPNIDSRPVVAKAHILKIQRLLISFHVAPIYWDKYLRNTLHTTPCNNFSKSVPLPRQRYWTYLVSSLLQFFPYAEKSSRERKKVESLWPHNGESVPDFINGGIELCSDTQFTPTIIKMFRTILKEALVIGKLSNISTRFDHVENIIDLKRLINSGEFNSRTFTLEDVNQEVNHKEDSCHTMFESSSQIQNDKIHNFLSNKFGPRFYRDNTLFWSRNCQCEKCTLAEKLHMAQDSRQRRSGKRKISPSNGRTNVRARMSCDDLEAGIDHLTDGMENTCMYEGSELLFGNK
ncbi:hypothetical protein DASC09_031740 [Saccharomycopsis crataegensis]|uniref:Uncharacterized protein n=1 Tax=Saccharomycopsis crataegensis TaxID=43959 RepID=A0AAV5QN31_9ASCO|nr:hypothetical protein DASC09_031740 [Saccharomycopsis crataegensis]